MFKRFADFLIKFKNTIFWTVVYTAAVWLIFRFIFGFNLLSWTDWAWLSGIRIHGFGGFAFGALLVASPLIYIASFIVIRRTKKPFITIKNPFVKKAKPETEKDEPKTNDKTNDIKYPTGLPEELREQYMRMRHGTLIHAGTSTILNPMPNETKLEIPKDPVKSVIPIPTEFTEPLKIDTIDADVSALPIPDDFNIDTNEFSTPRFREISFDKSPIPKSADDIVIKTINDKKFVIATHNDPDFWTGDGDEWFAAGKQKPNPILALRAAAKEHNAIPVLQLLEKNIMDIDELIKKWENDGIKVIYKLEEL